MNQPGKITMNRRHLIQAATLAGSAPLWLLASVDDLF